MHYGPQRTAAIDLTLTFSDSERENVYAVRLGYGADESLLFLSERVGFRFVGRDWTWTELEAGHGETLLRTDSQDVTARTTLYLLRKINFYHFHDTSRRSPLRTLAQAGNGGDYLRSDGSNLPAFLLGLSESEVPADRSAWRRIDGLIRRAAPFITALRPTEDRRGVRLEWADDQGETFGPAHLSDGTLRAIALFAALGQPEQGLPLMSCVNEPELGLHPSALEVLCGLVSSAAARRRVLLSTQSPVILDHFAPKEIVVAERQKGATQLRRLDEASLASWLEDYTLSELYDKNVLGGRP
jgi:predicted ATPase